MTSAIAPAGWQLTAGSATSALRFWEYKSVDASGNPINVSQRLVGLAAAVRFGGGDDARSDRRARRLAAARELTRRSRSARLDGRGVDAERAVPVGGEVERLAVGGQPGIALVAAACSDRRAAASRRSGSSTDRRQATNRSAVGRAPPSTRRSPAASASSGTEAAPTRRTASARRRSGSRRPCCGRRTRELGDQHRRAERRAGARAASRGTSGRRVGRRLLRGQRHHQPVLAGRPRDVVGGVFSATTLTRRRPRARCGSAGSTPRCRSRRRRRPIGAEPERQPVGRDRRAGLERARCSPRSPARRRRTASSGRAAGEPDVAVAAHAVGREVDLQQVAGQRRVVGARGRSASSATICGGVEVIGRGDPCRRASASDPCTPRPPRSRPREPAGQRGSSGGLTDAIAAMLASTRVAFGIASASWSRRAAGRRRPASRRRGAEATVTAARLEVDAAPELRHARRAGRAGRRAIDAHPVRRRRRRASRRCRAHRGRAEGGGGRRAERRGAGRAQVRAPDRGAVVRGGDGRAGAGHRDHARPERRDRRGGRGRRRRRRRAHRRSTAAPPPPPRAGRRPPRRRRRHRAADPTRDPGGAAVGRAGPAVAAGGRRRGGRRSRAGGDAGRRPRGPGRAATATSIWSPAVDR